MKVLAINASPHKDKGNTAMILGPFLDGMKEAGADVEIYYTSDLTIKPCLGDHACQLRTPGKCIQDDDMQWILPKVGQAEILVWATPVYDDGVTGPMKMLMDRLIPGAGYSIELRDGRLRHPLLVKGTPKKLALVSNCGFPEMETFDPMLAHIKAYCANASAEFAGALLRPAGPAMANMLKNGAPVADILEAAREAGRQLARDGRMSDEVLSRVSRPIISQEGMIQAVGRLLQQRPEGQAEQKLAEATPSSGTGRKRKEPSRLAERIAILRAGESRKPESERICYDPYAIKFVNPVFMGFALRYPDIFRGGIEQSDRFLPGISNTIAARVRYFDDVVTEALGKGFEQLVILGAGYDSRAYRIEGLKNIRVFEVDHPATLGMKSEKVRGIFGSIPGHVTYVPVDFDKETLSRRLCDCGYDPSKKTVFTMEGLIYYITPEAADETLSFIAHSSGKGSAVVFDYYPTSVIDGTCDDISGKHARSHAEALGEPLILGIDEPVEAYLSIRGFSKIERVTAADLKKRYFHGKNADRVVSNIYSFAFAVIE